MRTSILFISFLITLISNSYACLKPCTSQSRYCCDVGGACGCVDAGDGSAISPCTKCEYTPQEGDECDTCIQPLCPCELCPDGTNAGCCDGSCTYQKTALSSELSCEFAGFTSPSSCPTKETTTAAPEEGDECDICIRPLCACQLCPDGTEGPCCGGSCVYGKDPNTGDLQCVFSGFTGKTCPTPQEGDECDLCIRPLCACELCPDGSEGACCGGSCLYGKNTKTGELECVFSGFTGSECPTTTSAPETTERRAGEGEFCGGIGAIRCADGYYCADDPSGACDPSSGAADCGGICVSEKELIGTECKEVGCHTLKCLCATAGCPDGSDYGCCGSCTYQYNLAGELYCGPIIDECEAVDACALVDCAPGSICIDGECVSEGDECKCDGNIACKGPCAICSDGTQYGCCGICAYQDDGNNGLICSPYISGECPTTTEAVDACALILCAPGSICIDGECVTEGDKCDCGDIVCKPDACTKCSDGTQRGCCGECVYRPTADGSLYCTAFIDGQCPTTTSKPDDTTTEAVDACALILCRAGYICIDGECVTEPTTTSKPDGTTTTETKTTEEISGCTKDAYKCSDDTVLSTRLPEEDCDFDCSEKGCEDTKCCDGEPMTECEAVNECEADTFSDPPTDRCQPYKCPDGAYIIPNECCVYDKADCEVDDPTYCDDVMVKTKRTTFYRPDAVSTNANGDSEAVETISKILANCQYCLCSEKGQRRCNNFADFEHWDEFDGTWTDLVYWLAQDTFSQICSAETYTDLAADADGTQCEWDKIRIKDIGDITGCDCSAFYCEGTPNYTPSGNNAYNPNKGNQYNVLIGIGFVMAIFSWM